MAEPGWLDENSGRLYPFIPSAIGTALLLPASVPVVLPPETIVEFGSTLGPDAGFQVAVGSIYLSSINRSGSVLTFYFRIEGTSIDSLALTFLRHTDDADFTTSFATASIPGAGSGLPTWEGFLTTGPLAPLVAVLGSGSSLSCGTTFGIEPTLILNRSGAVVRSVRLANTPRTYAEPVSGCAGPSIPPAPDDGIHIASDPLVLIRLQAGFNTSFRSDVGVGGYVAEAAPGAGAGLTCADAPRFPGESAPVGSVHLGGGPSCAELVTMINGAIGPEIILEAGPGVSIEPDTGTPGSILVDFNLRALASCPS